MRRIAFFLAFLLAPTAKAQLSYPLQVQANGVTVNSQTLIMNFLPGCTPTKNGVTTNVTCTGAGGPFLPLAGGAMTRGGTGITQQWPVGSNLATGTYVLNPDSSGNLLVVNPGDTYPSWSQNFGTSASGDAQPDVVAKLCWNCQNGGGLVNPAYAASGIAFERHFVAGHPQTETHLTFTDTTPTEHRFISCEGHEDDNSTSCFYAATNINMMSGINSGANPSVIVNPTDTQLRSPANTHGKLLLDDAGAAQTILSDTDGVHLSQVTLSPNGEADLSGTLVRITNSTSGNVAFEDDGTNTNIYDDAHDVQMNIAGAQILIFNNGAPHYIFQAGQFFSVKRIEDEIDGIGTATDFSKLGVFTLNTTASTNVNTQQFSPIVALWGSAWSTAAGGSSQSSDWALQSRGQTGSVVTGLLNIGYSPDDSNVYDVANFQCLGANCTGRFYVPRSYNSGTALVAGDFAPGAGFGNTATVGTITGHDGMAKFTVTANGAGLAANPTIVLTFHDGTWTTTPICHGWLEAVTGATSVLATVITDTENATTLTLKYNGAALTAGDTVTIAFFCEGT